VGDKVLIKRGTENKYKTPYQGPYSITQVNENGTVGMMIKNVEDTVNTSRLTPYLDTDNDCTSQTPPYTHPQNMTSLMNTFRT
jgi:hypothetical protein